LDIIYLILHKLFCIFQRDQSKNASSVGIRIYMNVIQWSAKVLALYISELIMNIFLDFFRTFFF